MACRGQAEPPFPPPPPPILKKIQSRGKLDLVWWKWMCGLQLSPCSFSELAVSLSFPFSVASLYHAGDPTTQEGEKHGYCMDWGDCDQCIDDNKHCLPLGTEHWNWECIDDKVHATYFWCYPTKKCLFKVYQCWFVHFLFWVKLQIPEEGTGLKHRKNCSAVLCLVVKSI